MKFSRPFLKICKWCLVNKMSSNHKHSCSCYNQKQPKIRVFSGFWRTTLFLLSWIVPVLFVSIWILSSFYGGKFDFASEDNDNNQDMLEKAVSFACCRGLEYEMLPSSNIICAVKMPIFENPISDKCKFVTSENCSSFRNTTFSSVHLCYEENKLQPRELQSHAADHCNCVYIICLWVLIGTAISYNLCKLIMRRKHRMTQQQSCSTGKWRKKLLVVFALVGVIFSFWLFWYLKKDIMLRRKETLASMCDERARMLQDQFNVSMNHVHALAILVSTFHHGKQPSAIDQKTFEDYTERTSFERPLTSGVAYALRVRRSEREHVERQYGWTIKKMDIEDHALANTENFSTSPIRDEYAPVIFSQKTVSHIVSIDMMSGKEDRDNILRARASGKGVLTSPFKLLKSNHLGVVLTFAVYNIDLPPEAMPGERIDATVGYLGASYDVPSLVEKLLHQLASKQTIDVNVYDTTSTGAPIKMYGADVADNDLLQISHLNFGDPARKHEMHCRFKHKPPPPWQAISASVGMLVITLLLGHIFHAAIKQIAKVEHDYREMMELKHRAEAADVAKSQFLATVSHEIRTPMNGVLGMLEMLMDTSLDVCQLDYVQTAHDSGKVLISLINKVLDQAKIESGRLELEAVPFDPRAVLDKALSIFSGKSHDKGIELAAYVSSKVPEVVIGDQERFGQIVINLIGNSIKFTHDKGHIFVSVHLADEVLFPHDEILRQSSNDVQDNSENPSFNTLSGFRVVDRWRSWEIFKNLSEHSGKVKLLVTVEDTGAGIPPEAQDQIFMPFMQADSSTSRKYGGTGIGLSISNRLVDLMGGEIGFASELDTGSTFSFTVSFARAEVHRPDISVFRGIRALVIDDKRIRAEVTRYHLQRLGISVDVTSCMESACSYLSNNGETSVSESDKTAMVLIDQEYWDKHTCIPFRDIVKTTRHANPTDKSALSFPLKIFLLSTGRNNKLKLDDLVDDLITKPLRLSALTSTLREATGKRLEMSSQPSSLKSLLRGKRILVVDDNFVNRRVAEGALRKYGGVVTCVEGGKFAVELLKPPHEFDACFMDLQMPEMDGFEATRKIRSLEKNYNEQFGSGKTTSVGWRTPILAMTADVIQATNEACVKCGMDDYISKPFGEGQLYSAVARFFETEVEKCFACC